MHILPRDRLTREYRDVAWGDSVQRVTVTRGTAVASRAFLAAVAVVVAMAVGACAGQRGEDPDGGPGWFSYGPTATPGPIDKVDWASATVEIPLNQTGCEAGQARFEHGRATVGGTPYQMFLAYWAPAPLYTDFDHDGRTDALVAVACARTPGLSNPPALLLAISGRDDRHVMGVLFSSKPRHPDGQGATFAADLHLEEDGAVRYVDRTWEGNIGCEVEWTWANGDFIHRSVDDSPACRRR